MDFGQQCIQHRSKEQSSKKIKEVKQRRHLTEFLSLFLVGRG
jgi:hypothetical protein